MKVRFWIVLLLIITGRLVTGCTVLNEPAQDHPNAPTQTIANEPTRALLDQDYIPGHQGEFLSIDVLILESFPVQVQAHVTGYLRDGCVELVDVTSERQDDTFVLTLNTRRPAGDVACTEALVPFDAVVSLDAYGLPAGTYLVIAGDQRTEFRLDVNNELQEEPVSCPLPGAGETSFQAVDREAEVGFCFLVPDNFTPVEPCDERTWILEGPEVDNEGLSPILTIDLFDLDEQSLEDWVDTQRDRLKLPHGKLDDQIALYQGIALDVEDWPDPSGARLVWFQTGDYVFQLTFSPLEFDLYPLATANMEALYELVSGSWMFLGD